MRASPNTEPRTPSPRWILLFAVLPLAAVALVLTEVTVADGPFRVGADAAIVLATFGAMALWVRGNRVALAQLERCACASEMPAIRVVPSQREHPSRQTPATRVPAPVSASARRRTGARLGG